jgi:hypothetical protein
MIKNISKSNTEEIKIISLLWLICSILLFEFNHNIFAWLCLIQSFISCLASIYYAYKHMMEKKNEESKKTR